MQLDIDKVTEKWLSVLAGGGVTLLGGYLLRRLMPSWQQTIDANKQLVEALTGEIKRMQVEQKETEEKLQSIQLQVEALQSTRDQKAQIIASQNILIEKLRVHLHSAGIRVDLNGDLIGT